MASGSTASSQFLPFRGTPTCLLGLGKVLVMGTVHDEGMGTGITRLDIDSGGWKLDRLPIGATALAADDEYLYIAGSDKQLHRGGADGGLLSPIGPALSTVPRGLVLLAGGRLATIDGATLWIAARDGEIQQQIPLAAEGSALAASADGTWLVVGTKGGDIAVYTVEERQDFALSATARMHQGAVSGLAFEPDELRFLSAGADGTLLSTHARGVLEPEDRGAGHLSRPSIILLAAGTPGDRFYTGSADRDLKAWERGSKRKPATLGDGVGATTALTVVELLGRPHLAQACEDCSVRLYPLDEKGRLDERARIYRGAVDWAKNAFKLPEAARRDEVVEQVARWRDAAAIQLLADRATNDSDHKLKVKATRLLGSSGNARAVPHLERLLKAQQESIRLTALTGLRALCGERDLRPLRLALKVGQHDVGARSVEILWELAEEDDQARALLVEALEVNPASVRTAALEVLEDIHPDDAPAADLLGLRSKRADIRRLSLVRLYQRKMLGSAEVQSALRRHGEDGDADVRAAAFLISLLSHPTLATALRAVDADLHRQLFELETWGASDPGDPPKPTGGPAPTGADLAALLQAMSSRALDTCLRGARGLAVLRDPRALGILLQLSRESASSARVATCRALQELGDPRAVDRLRTMLRDGDLGVRDAAFSALVALRADRPLAVAEAGLGAEHKDVRLRALQVLVEALRESGEGLPLLTRSLNDGLADVRREAFKAALNLQVGGDVPGSLRFVLQSLHADIRAEVSTEAQAQLSEEWAWPLLLELLEDPDKKIRGEVFAFSIKRARSRLSDVLRHALTTRYTDIRHCAVVQLSDKHPDAGARALLVAALDDAEEKVRVLAIRALVSAEITEALVGALDSPHPDVQLHAAVACAGQGDERALQPLLALAREKAPTVDALVPAWRKQVVAALGGLAELGHPDALPDLVPLIDHKDAALRRAASGALLWCGRASSLDVLGDALRHADATVRRDAAAGLAFCGDPLGASILFTPDRKAPVDAGLSLAAAVALGAVSEDQLTGFLDNRNAAIRRRAFLVMMLRETVENDGLPDRCLAALASAWPGNRMGGARALENFGDAEQFQRFVDELLRHRGELPGTSNTDPHDIDAELCADIALAITRGEPQLRARVCMLLPLLDKPKTEPFQRAWRVFARRSATALADLRAAPRPVSSAVYSVEQLEQLVFGAFVGLSRYGWGAADARVRHAALLRLVGLVRHNPTLTGAAVPVLTLALRDSHQPVRTFAFESLEALGTDRDYLGGEALDVDHIDVGVLGMKLLSATGGSAAGERVLRRVMLQRQDGLETEAARLLAERRGAWVPVLAEALEADSEKMRSEAIDGLARRISGEDAEEGAHEALRGALGSRYRKSRFAAARQMAVRNDRSALPVLTELLKSDRSQEQRSAIVYLVQLGGEDIPDLLLDRVYDDPGGTALARDLIRAAGNFRFSATFERLHTVLDRGKHQRELLQAMVVISGYDQRIDYARDAVGDRRWLKDQHPRHDALLARAVGAMQRLSHEGFVRTQIGNLRWALSDAVDPILALLAASPLEASRRDAMEAVGWRLREREGHAEPLVRGLEHTDITTRMLAAEGLALAGRTDGISVLMASAELLENSAHRQRAVLALGKLADARALDLLMRLADSEGHALQAVSSEAIGYMAHTDQADRIFKLLSAGARGGYNLSMRSLTGLRHFGSPDAWRLIRRHLSRKNVQQRRHAADLLGHDSDSASAEALVELLRGEPVQMVAQAAARSLRRIHGTDSIEPDLAFVQARVANLERDTVARLSEKASVTSILEVLPRIPSSQRKRYRDPLVWGLLSRDPLPLAEAAAGLSSHDGDIVSVATRILGRAGADGAEHGAALVDALCRWRARWAEDCAALAGHHGVSAQRKASGRLSVAASTLKQLTWACGRLRVGGDHVVGLVTLEGPAARSLSVRREAILALCEGLGGAGDLDALEVVVRSGEQELREMAVAGLARRTPARAVGMVERLLDDAPSLDRLLAIAATSEIQPALRTGAATVHRQGAVLRYLVAASDVSGLAEILANQALPEITRTGALEGLARIASPEIEPALLRVARDEDEEEELRKSAWRALRRARRYRQQGAASGAR